MIFKAELCLYVGRAMTNAQQEALHFREVPNFHVENLYVMINGKPALLKNNSWIKTAEDFVYICEDDRNEEREENEALLAYVNGIFLEDYESIM